jgi:hypothetical protein
MTTASTTVVHHFGHSTRRAEDALDLKQSDFGEVGRAGAFTTLIALFRWARRLLATECRP